MRPISRSHVTAEFPALPTGAAARSERDSRSHSLVGAGTGVAASRRLSVPRSDRYSFRSESFQSSLVHHPIRSAHLLSMRGLIQNQRGSPFSPCHPNPDALRSTKRTCSRSCSPPWRSIQGTGRQDWRQRIHPLAAYTEPLGMHRSRPMIGREPVRTECCLADLSHLLSPQSSCLPP